MLKKILTGLNLFVFVTVFSQTGIGTHTPEGALDVNSPNNEWGLVFPHVDEAENTKNPTGKNVKKGTVVYDLKENCIKYFNGILWSGCMLAPIANRIKLECSSVVLSQDIMANYPVSAQTTVSIPYLNQGEAVGYDETVISSKNITGLIAVLPSGFIKKGSGTLVFSISGTPSSSGDAKFSLSIAGIQCEFGITAKNYIDVEVPITNNFACDLNSQVGYTTLKGKHIISGKEVTVDYSGLGLNTNIKYVSCDVITMSNGFNLGRNDVASTLVITFSRPVTNIGIAFGAANTGELLTFTINDNQPIQLKSNSSCQENIKIIDNQISFNAPAGVGGNITVGGKWFTELTIQHNGVGNGSAFGFCLNNSDAL